MKTSCSQPCFTTYERILEKIPLLALTDNEELYFRELRWYRDYSSLDDFRGIFLFTKRKKEHT